MWDVVYLSFKTPTELFFFPFCFLVIVILLSIVSSVLFLMAIIIIIIILLWELSTPALVDGLPLVPKWQVTSCLQESSSYSSRSRYCCSLDGLHSCSYFQFLQSLNQSFCDCTVCTDYNWYYRHFHIPQFFQFPSTVQILIFRFVFFQCCSIIIITILLWLFLITVRL